MELGLKMQVIDQVKDILTSTLQLGERGKALTERSGLLGVIPEFDSMAVVTIVAAIEERFDIVVDDDDIEAKTFETVGTLTAFVAGKIGA